MDVYLINNKDGKDIFQFPVNPFNLDVEHEKKYTTVEIIDVGEADIPDKGTKIKKISFDTFFPDLYCSSYCRYEDIPYPTAAVEKLTKWMEQEEPLRLIIDDAAINELVTIESMPEKEQAGEIGDRYVTMNFRTYKDIKIEQYNPSAITTLVNNRATAAPTTNTSDGTYVVKQGDSLWSIAKWWWGDGSKWSDLYNKNKSIIGSNPNLIYPGQKLVF